MHENVGIKTYRLNGRQSINNSAATTDNGYENSSGERMVDIRLLKYCLEHPNDYSPQCSAVLELAYRETGDIRFLNEALRRKQAALLYWYIAPSQF